VIESAGASDEARACSFLITAQIFSLIEEITRKRFLTIISVGAERNFVGQAITFALISS